LPFFPQILSQEIAHYCLPQVHFLFIFVFNSHTNFVFLIKKKKKKSFITYFGEFFLGLMSTFSETSRQMCIAHLIALGVEVRSSLFHSKNNKKRGKKRGKKEKKKLY
jgi:hypothetical protein